MSKAIPVVTVDIEYTDRFRLSLKQTTQGIVEAARVVAEVNEKYGYASMVTWLKDSFDVSRQTGDNLLRVYRNLISTPNFSVDDIATIAPSALYLLSAPSTPASVKKEFKAKVVAGKPVTHAEVKRAVEKASPPKPAARVREAVAEVAAPAEPEPPPAPVDTTGRELPDKAAIRAAFSTRATHYMKAMNLLTEVSCIVNELAGDADARKPIPGGELLVTHRQQVKADLKNVRETLKTCQPAAVCPYCDGEKRTCPACKGLGWVCEQVAKEAPKRKVA